MNTTPIDRLRATHIEERDDLGPYCARDATTYPCDTIAALDALEEDNASLQRIRERIRLVAQRLGLANDFDLVIDTLQARLDAATEQAEALAGALAAIVDEGPICFPEDKERCHCCEGTKEHGHADDCDWMLGQDALRAYKEANNE